VEAKGAGAGQGGEGRRCYRRARVSEGARVRTARREARSGAGAGTPAGLLPGPRHPAPGDPPRGRRRNAGQPGYFCVFLKLFSSARNRCGLIRSRPPAGILLLGVTPAAAAWHFLKRLLGAVQQEAHPATCSPLASQQLPSERCQGTTCLRNTQGNIIL